jgi:hypothetical protein
MSDIGHYPNWPSASLVLWMDESKILVATDVNASAMRKMQINLMAVLEPFCFYGVRTCFNVLVMTIATNVQCGPCELRLHGERMDVAVLCEKVIVFESRACF